MRLENITWVKAEEYFKEHDIVVIPIGSLECHGRHLPLGTDTLIPNKILEYLEEKSDVLIAPTLPYGNTDYLTSFPGTISLGPDITYQVMLRIIDSLYKNGAKRFIVLNGHGGNNSILDRLSIDAENRGCILVQMNWWMMVWNLTEDYEGNKHWQGGHGGAQETAGIMAIDESLVDKDEIKDFSYTPLTSNIEYSSMATIRYKGVDIPMRRYTKKISDNGWFGKDHPKYATKDWGEKMLKATADYIASFIEDCKNIPLD